MAVSKVLLLVFAGLAVVTAIGNGPLLPTPLPEDTSTLHIEDNQNPKVRAPSVVTVSSETSTSSYFIPVNTTTHHEDSTSSHEETSTKQGRAMDLSTADLNSMANSINGSNKIDAKSSKLDLSDVSMDNDDMDLDFVSKNDKKHETFGQSRIVNKPQVFASDKSFSPLLMPSSSNAKDVIETTCVDSGNIYKLGARVERDCDEVCTCRAGGRLECVPRCQGPFFRRGKAVEDPLCSAEPVEDACCAILLCASNTDNTVEKESCVVGNRTYSVGENITEGCTKICHCQSGGNITCTPRCPVLEQRDDCVNIQDPDDSCCKLQLCDVTQDVEESNSAMGRDGKEVSHIMAPPPPPPPPNNNHSVNAVEITTSTDSVVGKMSRDFDNKLGGEQTPFVAMVQEKIEPIVGVNLLSNGTVQVVLRETNTSDHMVHLELSRDGGAMWTEVQLKNGLLQGLQDGSDYMIRSRETGRKFSVSIPKLKEDNNISKKDDNEGCVHNGKHRALDEEFHLGCSELCVCEEGGNVHCMPLVCPSHEGLELLDPSCEQWGPDPPSFEPNYPHCCPPAMRCINNGSCLYKETIIPNWSEVPLELSGCGKRCYCESGEVECQAVCAPLPALPPPSLQCLPPNRPAPAFPPGDTCCKEWACVPHGNLESVSTNNMTDKDVNSLNDFYSKNETDKLNKLHNPVFVTLPPDMVNTDHHLYMESFPDHDINKMTQTKFDNSKQQEHDVHQGPFFVPYAPQQPMPGKSDKNDMKHYEYPGPFADPNHKPVPVNRLEPFPFIKKHKDKDDFQHYVNSTPNKSKDGQKKPVSPNDTETQRPHHSEEHEEYPINDPYLSGNPIHIPYNPNGPGPGYFNPSVNKPNQQHFLNILQQANSNNPLVQPGAGLYHNGISGGSNQIPPGADTIHVYTDGSPVNIEHLLQHIQQADNSNEGHYIPYVTQQNRPNVPINQRPGTDGNNSSNQLPSGVGGFPPGGSGPGVLGGPAVGAGEEGALQVVTLEANSPTSLRLVITLPSVMIGLHGFLQLRYTDSSNPDPSSWRLQKFAPPDNLLATSQLEFQVGSLQPDTLYQLQAALILRELPYAPRTHVYSVRTLTLNEEATMPPIIPIEPNLSIGQVNPTSAQVNWRPFTQDELVYIDGIQLRYREIDGKVFSGTTLIHRAVTSFQLEGLKPNTSYEVGIYFIPFLGQHTELQSSTMVRLKTTQQTDIYDWSVTLEVSEVTAWGLMLHWSGVPRPAERYVHVVRAVWRAEAARGDSSTFTLPTRDAPPVANITGLTPGTRYRIWLELYMTNGKVKTSNVKDVMTKPGKPAPQEASVAEGKLLEGGVSHRGDYYSSLVAVAILAALGGMCSLLLLLVLLRRHRAASAPICAPVTNAIPAARNHSALPPYDSPTYKLDLHQETMDL